MLCPHVFNTKLADIMNIFLRPRTRFVRAKVTAKSSGNAGILNS
jgi:hypothetical protein